MHFTNTTSSAIDPRSAGAGILVLRLALGAMWIAHALLKLVVFTLPGTMQFFIAVGLPGALVYPVVAAELLGGLAIMLGFHGRHASLALLPILMGALWVHLPNGWVFTAQGGGWEYAAFLAAASLAHALLGDGIWALRARPLLPAPAPVAEVSRA